MGNITFYLYDHLGNTRVTYYQRSCGSTLTVENIIDYDPYGKVLREFSYNNDRERYVTTQHERDEETGYDYRGARFYDSDIARFLSVDPMAQKLSSWSTYNFVMANPIILIDPNGKEPIRPQAGSVSTFMQVFNNTPSRMGLSKGSSASSALVRLGATEMNWEQGRPNPSTTPYFNNRDGRYIYTEKGGWIDMVHFLFYAGKAYGYKEKKEAAIKQREKTEAGLREAYKGGGGYWPTVAPYNPNEHIDPFAEAIQAGFQQERSDMLFAKHSAYSYEDLPSNFFGAEFGAKYFDPNSELTLGEQLSNYLNSNLGATAPQNAPNYDLLPNTEPTEKPSRTNHTSIPVYVKSNP
jgi:RHS repeat-associated protein